MTPKRESLRVREHGYVLLLIMAVLFLLVTAMVALFWTQSVSRAELSRAESDLMAAQATQFELFKRIYGTDARPPWVSGGIGGNSLDQRIQGWANQIFQKDRQGGWSLPALRTASTIPPPYDPSGKAYPGHQYWLMDPGGWANRERFWAITSQALPYAAVSWNGSVSLDSVSPWQNPRFGESPAPLTMQSGVAPWVAAAAAVNVTRMPYGFAYVTAFQEGFRDRFSASQPRVQVNTAGAAPGAVGVINPAGFPLWDQASAVSQLRGAIDAAMERSYRQSTDRGDALFADISIGDTLGLFLTQYLAPHQLYNPSLKQAQTFPLPALPGLINQLDIVIHICLHVPYTPDGGDNSWAQGATEALKKIVELLTDAEKLIEKISWLQEKLSLLGKWNPLYWITWTALEAAKIALDIVLQAIEVIISPIMLALDAVLAVSGEVAAPHSRAQEEEYVQKGLLSEEGCNFWCYREVFNKLGSIAKDVISLHFTDIAQEFYGNVNLTFFGQKDKIQAWSWSGTNMSASATINVPRGRTFSYPGDLSLKGDLWLQRGSSMVVKGDLKLTAGDGSDGNRPMGRIYLEEGATLVVGRGLSAAGDARGSVIVGSPVGDVHPTTAAILCAGNVVLPYGVVSGLAFDEIPVPGSDPHRGKSPMALNLMGPLLQGGAANLAKITGPFHDRLPYVARFTTTFQFIPELGVPFVGPMEWSNMIVPAFRALSYLYTPALNLSLGENFLTHSDWWGNQGEGRAAMVSKADGYALAQVLGSAVSSPFGFSDNDLSTWIKARLDTVATSKVDELANNLCLKLGASLIKALPDVEEIPVGDIISSLVKDIFDHYDLDQMKKDLDNLVPQASLTDLASNMSTLWTLIGNNPGGVDAKSLTQECGGVLVYAGGTLRLGQTGSGNNWSDTGAPLATGFFVSEGDMALHTQVTVGAAVSFSGSIEGKELLFYPDFTRASLFLPAGEAGDWRTRATLRSYGNRDGSTTVEVGGWLEHLTLQSWEDWGR